MTRSPCVLFAALALFALPGCSGTPSSTTARRGPVRARDLYPMGEGYIWTYDIDTQTGISSLGIYRVVRAAPPRYTIVADGSTDEHTYEFRDEGIWNVGTNAWLVRDPLVVGEEWETGPGRRTRITAVDAEADVPAGHFEGCVELTEHNAQTERDSRTVLCPGQGPVEVEVHQPLSTTGGITLRIVLRAPVQRGMEDVEQPGDIETP